MGLFGKKGAHQWRGVIDEYRRWLPVTDQTPVISLREGGTPLVYACVLSEMLGNQVWLKVEGANPTGSFKDRGMTMAISKGSNLCINWKHKCQCGSLCKQSRDETSCFSSTRQNCNG
jgi:threonine synthase